MQVTIFYFCVSLAIASKIQNLQESNEIRNVTPFYANYKSYDHGHDEGHIENNNINFDDDMTKAHPNIMQSTLESVMKGMLGVSEFIGKEIEMPKDAIHSNKEFYSLMLNGVLMKTQEKHRKETTDSDKKYIESFLNEVRQSILPLSDAVTNIANKLESLENDIARMNETINRESPKELTTVPNTEDQQRSTPEPSPKELTTVPNTEDQQRSTPEPVPKCPSHWTTHSTGCYLYLAYTMTWLEAKTACREYDGNLVEISGPNQFSYVRDAYGNSSFWVGGYFQESRYVWEKSGKEIDSGIWAADEPHYSYLCVQYWSKGDGLDDYGCNWAAEALCFQDLNPI